MTNEREPEAGLGGTTTVAVPARAQIVADRRRRFVLWRLREYFHDTFWLLPALFLVGALLLAAITRAVDETLSPVIMRAAPWVTSASDARIVLAALATAALAFLGVVFSIGFVALLASRQSSPRVLRDYARSTTTKVALGTFIATFIYSLMSLGYLEELIRGGRPVSTISVTVAMALAVASIIVFIAYATFTIRGMRMTHVISTVAAETDAALSDMFPTDDQYLAAESPVLFLSGRLVLYLKGMSSRAGVVQGVDVVTCMRRAREHDVLLRLLPRVGQHIARGEPLFEVYPVGDSVSGGPANKQLLCAVHIGRERVIYQDPFYGIQTLVDVASRALSPVVNAPTTAVQVLDCLQDFLRFMASRPWPSGLLADETGEVRLVVQVPSWEEFVDLALTEITEFGARSPQVTRRLGDLLDTLIPIVPDERKHALVRHKGLLAEAVAHRFA
jgi:uncharacterized membrane protein